MADPAELRIAAEAIAARSDPQADAASAAPRRAIANDNIFRPLAQQARWRLAAIMFMVGAEALLYGYSYPFFSLALEKLGLSNWLIGLNASLTGAGILFLGPFLPRLIDRLGLKQVSAGLFVVSLLSFAAILVSDHILVWFAARFVMGGCFAAMWSTNAIWLHDAADDRNRGRMISAAVMLYSVCAFAGPFVLSFTGVTGALPLIVAMIPLAAGAGVALMIPAPAKGAEEAGHDKATNWGLAISLAGALIGAAFLAGAVDPSMQGLLPLYGLDHGYSDAEAARLVTVLSLGDLVVVAALGWVADRYGGRRALQLCAVLAAVVTVMLPLGIGSFRVLLPTFFLAGGTSAGVYTLGVVLIGQDFRGRSLAVVSTAFAMAYSAGSLIGAAPIGLAIDLFGSAALPLSLAVAFLGLVVFLLVPRRRSVEAPRRRTPTATGLRAAG